MTQNDTAASQERFAYRSLDELLEAFASLGLELPTSDDLAALAEPIKLGRLVAPNRLAIQPMEGCDANPDGSPGELTIRRYDRFAAGGAGLIWFEACAVTQSGKANPRQLWINEQSVGPIAEMLMRVRACAAERNAPQPVCVLQLTHSGRYCRPLDKPAPLIAHHSSVLDPRHNLPGDYPLISDSELDALQEDFVRAARLAAQAGFDAVDIKSCHGYLLNELLASFTREGRYGGSFENRTRMLRQTVAAVRDAVGDQLEVTTRLNIHDAVEHPFGWGMRSDAGLEPDLSEPLELISQLRELGVNFIDLTAGNPYFNPHVNRPADAMIANWPAPPEPAVAGAARLVRLVRDVQQANRTLPVVGSGYSWLRHYLPPIAAGLVRQGWVSVVGVGRGGFAYPDFARDILAGRGMDPRKVCIACSRCSQMMRDGQVSGCAVRDAKVYGPIYRQGREIATR